MYFLYRIDDPETAGEGSPYVFVGYNTSFRCWFQDGLQPQKPTLSNGEGDPSIDLSQIPNLKHACRHRIAQFLILPPFAGKGHGEMFYTAIFHDLTSDPTCRFLTVEDPNEQFDDLRDLCDLTRLRADPESFKDLALDTTLTIPKRGPLAHDLIPYDAISARAAQLKLARVQLVRLLELQLLDEVPEEEKVRTEAQKKVYRAWRVWVKMRVYRKNKELLAEFDIEERRERLDRTLEGLEENYRRVLAKLAARKGERGVKRKGSGEEGEDEGGGLREEGRRGKGKKLRLDDDSD